MNLSEIAERLLILEQHHEAHKSLFLLLINMMLACDEQNRRRVADGIQKILQHPDVLGSQDSELLRDLLRTVRAQLIFEPDAELQAKLSESPLRPIK